MTEAQIQRGQMAAHAAVSLIPAEHSAVRRVDDITGPEAARLARMVSQMGDISYAVMHGTTSLEDALVVLMGSAVAWIEQIGAERAAR